MSFSSPLDTKEQVRQATDIVELVGRYMTLRRSGRTFVGLCPWHDDTHPSMQVNPQRQSFKCYVCDIGGDVFSFIMQMEGLDFRESLQMLADRAGIRLTPMPSSHGPHAGGSNASGGSSGVDKRALLQAMAWAETQYHQCLVELPEGSVGRDYLAGRRMAVESIATFHLGYAPMTRDWLISRAKLVGADPRLLEVIGVLARSESGGSPYDRFRGRLLFPIRDTQNRPVGFGGRILPESGLTSKAKYVNSPETPLFSKSRMLYGLDVGATTMRKSRRALVMEGYTDCIAAHEYGFTDAVAVLGTALGEEHLRVLKRYADQIFLVLDGDEAGRRRANEVLEMFIAQQIDLRIVTLPAGHDPCEFLQEHGTEAFADLLEHRAVDALEHAFETHTHGLDLDRDTHAAAEALERLIAIMAQAPRPRIDTPSHSRFREEKILQRLAGSFRVSEEDVRQRLAALRRVRKVAPARRPSSAGPPGNPANGPNLPPDGFVESESEGEVHEAELVPPSLFDRELLQLLLREPNMLAEVRAAISVGELDSPLSRRVFQTCCRLADAEEAITYERLMLEFDEPVAKSLLVGLDEEGGAKGDVPPEVVLRELLRSHQRREAEREMPADAGKIRAGGLDEEETLALLKQIEQKQRVRQGISNPTDGDGP